MQANLFAWKRWVMALKAKQPLHIMSSYLYEQIRLNFVGLIKSSILKNRFMFAAGPLPASGISHTREFTRRPGSFPQIFLTNSEFILWAVCCGHYIICNIIREKCISDTQHIIPTRDSVGLPQRKTYRSWITNIREMMLTTILWWFCWKPMQVLLWQHYPRAT